MMVDDICDILQGIIINSIICSLHYHPLNSLLINLIPPLYVLLIGSFTLKCPFHIYVETSIEIE